MILAATYGDLLWRMWRTEIVSWDSFFFLVVLMMLFGRP